MTSLALARSCAERSLASQIRTFIAQYLKVDADSIDARSCLSDDFGLDLFDIIELMITLEQKFCTEGEITDDPNQMECVEDLIRHIEQHRGFSHVDSCHAVSSARCLNNSNFKPVLDGACSRLLDRDLLDEPGHYHLSRSEHI